jgi:hypothetical protein
VIGKIVGGGNSADALNSVVNECCHTAWCLYGIISSRTVMNYLKVRHTSDYNTVEEGQYKEGARGFVL